VATDAGGTAEIARHNSEALIVPCANSDALLAAIRQAIDDRAETMERARRARGRVETELSFDARLRRVEAVYDRLMTPNTTH
jgi:glycosyltransferase involved in cell wall biosynthesis